jgi:hypothetical protein
MLERNKGIKSMLIDSKLNSKWGNEFFPLLSYPLAYLIHKEHNVSLKLILRCALDMQSKMCSRVISSWISLPEKLERTS